MKLRPWLLAGALLVWGCTQPNTSPYSTATSQTTTNTTEVVQTAAPSATPAATTSATPGASATPKATPKPAQSSKLEPLPGVKAPKLTKVVKVKFTTTRGDILIDVYPEAAPNAAKRFVELVEKGFYNDTPIFRVVPGFVCQFGLNSKMKDWHEKKFKDDPSLFYISPGTLAFAKAGPDTNSTQVFINYGDNTSLVTNGNFSAFAKISKGFELTPDFKAVGDPSMGLDQGQLGQDTQGYLKSLPDKPDMIKKAVVVKK